METLPVRDSGWGPQQRPGSTMDSALVAEDDPIFRHLLERWLEKWNYRVTAVENGMDAWNVLQQPNTPQMVVLDWMMPGMDGVELCQRIRANPQGPYRYVLLLTAKDEKQDVIAGLEAGADDYLTKPFDVNELRARVRSGKRILDLQDALLRTQEALQYEAAHDPLTGVWNRGAILDLLRRETKRHQRTGCPLGVIMVDVDHFKTTNDTHGHLVGDAVLQEISRRLQASVRAYDLIGRYGGEEFLIVIPSCRPPDLEAGAERLRRCVGDRPILTTAGEVICTISLGVASASSLSRDSAEYEVLLRTADEALYLAKAEGRNRVHAAARQRTAPLPRPEIESRQIKS
jgi:diguanylate cyclase (GGDEF)-like protein